MSARVSIITQVVVVKAPTTIIDVVPYVLVFLVYGLMVQVVFALWKKFHEKSYNYFILSAILACLPSISFFFGNYAVLFLYFLFISFMGYLVYTALNFSQKKNGPRIIFRAFKMIFLVTNHATVLLQFCLIVFFVTGINRMLAILKLMSYSIYFAVLSREIVRNICIFMAKTTGYYSKEGIPGKKENSALCMICTLPFDQSSALEKVFSLKCGHSYHEDCIKGWALIGQNNCCYYCKEGIDNKVFTQDYWIKSEIFIKPMMNAMRSLIAFSIVVIGLVYLKLFVISTNTEE
ncbi:uncharacterized protein VICG_01930 [Vittaforma corneae ATCC 50505]|uniref:RING-type domain-containing protein n=1 Tax=Vittaforma corneae (strain ATCC 50505) TaxID=993615 RepID=L2GJJ9_VITCO|nr:uncharacterized protein VICG_01930 [Vittaforma corneae ATCC 50505]ELA41048.1 hypothetical protein VICG_01930 [Vittaforma corneae ATCC 50505]